VSKSKERITIADVAEKADVSAMTVSRVLNNKGEISEATRQHVLTVMHELGYRPNRVARSLATAKTLKIGVIVPSISSAYFGAVLEGAERLFWDRGYHMMLCNTGEDTQREQTILDLFEEDRADGVLVLSSHLSGEELSDYLRKQRAAVVINSEVQNGVACHVRTDEMRSMSVAVGHLVKNGRRCLAYVGGDWMTYAGRQRHDSFIAAMQAAGLPADSNYMMNCNRRSGYIIARQLLQEHPEIDGLICFNDEIAAGALRACFDLGRRVPNEVAVIGYDDIFLAELLNPSLTTLRLSLTKREVGALAGQMLLERIEGSSTRDEVVLEHELVVRESAP
jgi:DNA-binding LacI/PurR family transcriptional regulator